MKARISAVSYYLPEGELSNEAISKEFPEWTVDKISSKTGIRNRHIAGAKEFSSDLAVNAAEKLFSEHFIDRITIDYVILCTQSPDYFLPSTACIVQDRLALRTEIGATDITLGCSGYVYALGLAKGLIESGQTNNVLVLTADTYSKFLNPRDKSVRTIFGDGASASLVTGDAEDESIYALTYGTDGSGAKNLIVPSGGLREGQALSPRAAAGERNLEPSGYDLFMDGPEIFNFSIRVVPETVERILRRAQLEQDEIDLFVFHQANQFMLEHLRKRLDVPPEKFFISLENSGNTVSSTIPIALAEAVSAGVLLPGMRLMLLGFGVGLSWGGLIVRW